MPFSTPRTVGEAATFSAGPAEGTNTSRETPQQGVAADANTTSGNPSGQVSSSADAQRPEDTAGQQPDVSQAVPTVEDATESTETNPTELTEAELQEIFQLRAQDRAVRSHEQAHIAAGGRYITSGASFSYTVGPDGRQYAVAGEVSIDASKAATPEQTLIKAQAIRRAALAPAEPSAQDRSVAAQAAQLEYQARREIAQESLRTDENPPSPTSPAPGTVQETGEDFEFTEIGLNRTEDNAQASQETRTPIANYPVPLSPDAGANVGQLIDYFG
ncbi:MAG: hypothetical protein KC944_19860 [Candidatus Omnitrophica bacterium]|nr:hypothetical protein [Candidatus Omnitrophota bacterium]